MVSPDSAPDRRPIPARNAAWAVALARVVAAAGVSPNAVSMAGMLPAIGAGVALACTPHSAVPRVLFGIAAALIPLRLLANMLDGMVAVEFNKVSPTGELYNDVPDRISDSAVLAGAGYAITSSPMLGVWAALAAVFVTYIRALGKGTGQKSDFRGPMAKQQRMLLIILAGAYLALAPASWWFSVRVCGQDYGVMANVLVVVIVGCVITAARRLSGIARGLHARSAPRP